MDGARLVELPGGDLCVLSSARAIEEIGAFLSDERPPVEVDRILTMVLITDIVGSNNPSRRVTAVGLSC
jgi:hypothetical protein